MAYDAYRTGRNISGMDGFVPAGTKFDTVPTLRSGEQVQMTSDDLYVMRGLFCGEAGVYAKHMGKLSIGDAIATAKDSAGMLRRMSIYEGTVRPSMYDCRRLPVMDKRSVLSSSEYELGTSGGKFYRRFADIARKMGAMGFPEVQKLDLEALWVLNQAQAYCADPKDKSTLQRMIPLECQPAVDALNRLVTCDSSEGILTRYRIDCLGALSSVSERGRFACEMSLKQLSDKHPGKSVRSSNVIWTGLPGNRVRGLSTKFLSAWSKASPVSQARSIAQVVPGPDIDLPVGCIRYTHSAFGGRYQSEFPFYDSDELKDWARSAYSEAVANGTMDKLDVVLPKTVSASDIIPASFSETEYAHACAKRMERANEAFLSAFRDVSDLNAAAAAVGGTGSGVSEGQSL